MKNNIGNINKNNKIDNISKIKNLKVGTLIQRYYTDKKHSFGEICEISNKDTTGLYLKNINDESDSKGSFMEFPKSEQIEFKEGNTFLLSSGIDESTGLKHIYGGYKVIGNKNDISQQELYKNENNELFGGYKFGDILNIINDGCLKIIKHKDGYDLYNASLEIIGKNYVDHENNLLLNNYGKDGNFTHSNIEIYTLGNGDKVVSTKDKYYIFNKKQDLQVKFSKKFNRNIITAKNGDSIDYFLISYKENKTKNSYNEVKYLEKFNDINLELEKGKSIQVFEEERREIIKKDEIERGLKDRLENRYIEKIFKTEKIYDFIENIVRMKKDNENQYSLTDGNITLKLNLMVNENGYLEGNLELNKLKHIEYNKINLDEIYKKYNTLYLFLKDEEIKFNNNDPIKKLKKFVEDGLKDGYKKFKFQDLNGSISTKRIFISQRGDICEYIGKSRTKGIAIDLNKYHNIKRA